MIEFAVYEPPNTSGDRVDRAERLVFVNDGFIWTAAIVPAVWLLAKGLWLELLVFICAAAALTWGFEAKGAPATASAILLLIVQIVFGFEAGAIQGAALERRGWRSAGTVIGRDGTDCERRFFESWLPSQPADQPPLGATPTQRNPISSWTETAWQSGKGALARGRRLIGAKA